MFFGFFFSGFVCYWFVLLNSFKGFKKNCYPYFERCRECLLFILCFFFNFPILRKKGVVEKLIRNSKNKTLTNIWLYRTIQKSFFEFLGTNTHTHSVDSNAYVCKHKRGVPKYNFIITIRSFKYLSYLIIVQASCFRLIQRCTIMIGHPPFIVFLLLQ